MELSGRLKILERLAQLLLLLKGEIRCTGASLEDAFLDVAKKMPGEYRLFLEETAGRIGERSGIAFEVQTDDHGDIFLPIIRQVP